MISVKEISFKDIINWNAFINKSFTATFFQTKEWLQLWVNHFGNDKAKLFGVFEKDVLVGIVPLYVEQNSVQLLGNTHVLGKELVSDFGDVIALSGREMEVWEAVIKNFQFLISNFQFIREDSPSFKILQDLGGKVEEVDVAPYIDLPKTWEEYLQTLNRHDRHELRRKMKKLEAQGAVVARSDGNPMDREEFFRLMQLSNEQKKNFLSEGMRVFFSDIFSTFFPLEITQLHFLKMDGKNIASILSFEYHNEVLLYNSGFDPNENNLSPGFILKAYAIKEAIEKGRSRFDFLRGSERYKYDLGAKNRKLYKIIL